MNPFHFICESAIFVLSHSRLDGKLCIEQFLRHLLWGSNCFLQSQELGQMAILPFPHGALMRRQQMSFPGLARLGLMQWAEGQDGELRARDFGLKDPMPVTAVRKDEGSPALAA